MHIRIRSRKVLREYDALWKVSAKFFACRVWHLKAHSRQSLRAASLDVVVSGFACRSSACRSVAPHTRHTYIRATQSTGQEGEREREVKNSSPSSLFFAFSFRLVEEEDEEAKQKSSSRSLARQNKCQGQAREKKWRPRKRIFERRGIITRISREREGERERENRGPLSLFSFINHRNSTDIFVLQGLKLKSEWLDLKHKYQGFELVPTHYKRLLKINLTCRSS